MSAWRNLGEFGQRSSLRTWLYQIATNRCLSMLRADSRRPRIAPPLPEATLPEPTSAGDAPPWLEPYPDVLPDYLVDQRPGPEARYETTEAISLAFITALQLLPPRQRAALVLRDVLGYHAAEVAQMLDTTQEAVNSALKRARATVDNHLADSSSTGSTGSGSSGTGSRRPARQPDTAAEHRLVARLTDALERADLDALIELLVTDVRLSMPRRSGIPRHRIGPARLRRRHLPPRPHLPRVPTRANGQPAFGLYLADPHASVYRAYCLLVITTAGDHITAITSFSTNIMTRFGLPRTLPKQIDRLLAPPCCPAPEGLGWLPRGHNGRDDNSVVPCQRGEPAFGSPVSIPKPQLR